MKKLLALVMSLVIMCSTNFCYAVGSEVSRSSSQDGPTPQEERCLKMLTEVAMSAMAVFKANGIADFNELYVGRYLVSKNQADLVMDKRYLAISKSLDKQLIPKLEKLQRYYIENKRHIRFSELNFVSFGCPLGSIDAVLDLFLDSLRVSSKFMEQLELLYQRVDADEEDKFQLDPADAKLLEAHEYMISHPPGLTEDTNVAKYVDKYLTTWVELFDKAQSSLQDDFRTPEYAAARGSYINHMVVSLCNINVSVQWILQLVDAMNEEVSETYSEVEGAPAAHAPKNTAFETVNGALLPKTASNSFSFIALGLIIASVGYLLTTSRRRKLIFYAIGLKPSTLIG